MKTKILFLITKATWGGAQRYVWDLATNLPTETFHASVVYGTTGKLSDMLSQKDISHYRIPSLGRDIAVVSDVTSFFRILIHLYHERPDIVHLNSSKAAALGALAARLTGVPRIVFTVHGWPYKEERPRAWRAIIYFLSWATAILSHVVIVVSKADEVQGHQMAFIGKKIVYIPIGVSTREYLPRAGAWKKIHEIIGGEPNGARIVTIAELTPNKGLFDALEAVALLKKQGRDLTYVIIGDGEERTRLAHAIEQRELGDRVFITGFIDDASQYLRAFDVFLLSSHKEGMPYVLLEAARAHLPIVTTKAVNPEFIGSFQNVRAVNAHEPAALAAAVLESVAEKRSEHGPASEDARYDMATMVGSTIDSYRST